MLLKIEISLRSGRNWNVACCARNEVASGILCFSPRRFLISSFHLIVLGRNVHCLPGNFFRIASGCWLRSKPDMRRCFDQPSFGDTQEPSTPIHIPISPSKKNSSFGYLEPPERISFENTCTYVGNWETTSRHWETTTSPYLEILCDLL